MKQFIILISIATSSVFIFSCGKNGNCSTENTGSILIHNDSPIMPTGIANFYRGSTLLASISKGSSVTVNNVPAGDFIMTVKQGADTIFRSYDTIIQCGTLHYYTSIKYDPSSDKRLKKNILAMNNVLANICRLNIYSFEYNAPKNYTGFLPGGLHYGFMAQELKDVYPTFVSKNTDGYYAVNYGEMIPILAKGIQEQQSQIDDLKKEVAELKGLVKLQQTLASK